MHEMCIDRGFNELVYLTYLSISIPRKVFENTDISFIYNDVLLSSQKNISFLESVVSIFELLQYATILFRDSLCPYDILIAVEIN